MHTHTHTPLTSVIVFIFVFLFLRALISYTYFIVIFNLFYFLRYVHFGRSRSFYVQAWIWLLSAHCFQRSRRHWRSMHTWKLSRNFLIYFSFVFSEIASLLSVVFWFEFSINKYFHFSFSSFNLNVGKFIVDDNWTSKFLFFFYVFPSIVVLPKETKVCW